MMRIYFRYVVYLFVALWFSSSKAGVYDDFFTAAARDDGRTVRQLIERGFDVNSRDPKGQTALHLALRDGSFAVAEALWTSPALDVGALNANGESPLMMAALRGNLAWAQRLLQRGAPVHKDGWSPIHYAATGPEPQVIALLLDKGAPIDAESPNRSTPLMMASRYGSEAGVDLLLKRGADARRRNDLNLSAIDFARQGGRDFLVERLQKAATR
jgi:ankyrin repeat protein